MTTLSAATTAALADAIDTILSAFGRQFTYKPAVAPHVVGHSRTITAAVEYQRTLDRDGGRRQVEELEILVKRDASDATYGGIDKPRLTDELIDESDPDRRPYHFVGESRSGETNPHAWRLTFERQTLDTVGAGR